MTAEEKVKVAIENQVPCEIIFHSHGLVEMNGFASYIEVEQFAKTLPSAVNNFLESLEQNKCDLSSFIYRVRENKEDRIIELKYKATERSCIYNGDDFLGFIDTMFLQCSECRTRLYCAEKFVGSTTGGKLILFVLKVMRRHERLRRFLIRHSGYSQAKILKFMRRTNCNKKINHTESG